MRTKHKHMQNVSTGIELSLTLNFKIPRLFPDIVYFPKPLSKHWLELFPLTVLKVSFENFGLLLMKIICSQIIFFMSNPKKEELTLLLTPFLCMDYLSCKYMILSLWEENVYFLKSEWILFQVKQLCHYHICFPTQWVKCFKKE